MKKSTVIFVSALALFIFSCKKLGFDKIASTAWNPNLAVPLAFGTFDIYDIFTYHDTSELVVIDENSGLVALLYRSDLIVASAEELVTLGQFNENLVLSGADLNLPPLPAFSGSVDLNNDQTIFIDVPAGVEIHNVHLKSGTLNLTVTTDLAHSVTSVITLPGVTINGEPIQETLNLNYTGTVPHSASTTVNLTGAIMDCTNGNTTVNTLQINISSTVTGSGQGINGNEYISLDFNSNGMAFKTAYGYFGQQSIVDLQDSILIQLFENGEGGGYFELSEPSLKLFVDNGIGLPIRLNLDNLRTINAFNGNEFFMENYPAIHNLNFPSILGVVVQTLIEFNTANTPNIAQVIAPVPQYLAFSLTAETNPDGPSATLNFISDTSKVKVRSELEMPLIGFAHGFGAKDTFPFNLGVQAEEIQSVMFRLNIDNGFPVKLNAQITFMDENYMPLFSAWDQPVAAVDAALTDSEGVVNQRTVQITDFIIDGTNIDLLKQAKYFEVMGTAKTLDALSGHIIKVFDWYNIKVRLAMQIQGNVKL